LPGLTRQSIRNCAAYPRFDEFVAAKRRTDPQLRFCNAMWDAYLALFPAAANPNELRRAGNCIAVLLALW
jgi:hypothetical protein